MSELNTEWDNVPASRVLPAWREQVRKLSLEINELWDKNQTLKSDVERLTLLQSETLSERNKAEAEVERLIKAGDAIYESFDQFGQVDAITLKRWQTAKDGIDAQ